jgi:hypothetical protein
MTTALEGGEGSASRPGRSLPPGKTRYPLYRRLGGPHSRSGQVRKISPLLGFDLRTVQPVASRYTDYATRPTLFTVPSENSEGGGGVTDCGLRDPKDSWIKADETGCACGTHGREICAGFWSDNLIGRDQLVELVVDRRILTYFVGNY